MVHAVPGGSNAWTKNTEITRRQAARPETGELSPNKGYYFAVEGGRPIGRVTIHAEKDHLVDIQFVNLFWLTDVRWLNEKLIFMRPWWGRIAATDLIFDVEREEMIYAESVTDATVAYQQYQESCPIHGCQCIKKR